MTNTPQFLLASAAAALSTIIVPVAIGLYVFFQGSSVLPDGTIDNAPFRAAGILLFLLPLVFVILIWIWYSVTKALFYFNSLTKKKLLVFCIACAIFMGSIFAFDGYKAFGLKDAIISFIVFFSCTFICLGLGGLVWWPVAHARHNKIKEVMMSKRSIISTLLYTIWAVAILGVIAFLGNGDKILLAIGNDKIFETTYQFLLITVIGGALAYLYKEFDRERDIENKAFERERDALRTLHDIWYKELLEAYNKAKSVRRQLRADLGTIHLVDGDKKIDSIAYQDSMDSLSETQLVFETYAKSAETSRRGLFDSRTLSMALSMIERYLNQILKEYQDQFSAFSGDPLSRELRHLPRLLEFIGPYDKAGDFKSDFKMPFRTVIDELGNIKESS